MHLTRNNSSHRAMPWKRCKHKVQTHNSVQPFINNPHLHPVCPRAAGVGVRRGRESGHRAASELQGAPRRPSRRPLRRLVSLNVGPPGGGTRLSVLVFLSISCPAQTFWVFTRKPRAFNTFHSSLLLRRPPLLSFENNNQQVS